MARLFNRIVRVSVGDRVFSVRAVFQVEKSQSQHSNKAQVSLYNLSDDSRGFVERAAPKRKGERSNIQARILAGYDGETSLIFSGNVTNVFNSRSGPDILTTVECGDGEVAIQQTDIILGFKGGVDERKIAQACIDRLKALGLKEGFIHPFKNKLYENGFSYAGRCTKLLTTICKNQGLTFSVQDGAIQVLVKGSHTAETAVELSEETGLVDIPTKNNGLFKARSLLNGDIRPGRQVYLKSLQTVLSGYFIADKVWHQGDSQEGDFNTVVEGKPLG